MTEEGGSARSAGGRRGRGGGGANWRDLLRSFLLCWLTSSAPILGEGNLRVGVGVKEWKVGSYNNGKEKDTFIRP